MGRLEESKEQNGRCDHMSEHPEVRNSEKEISHQVIETPEKLKRKQNVDGLFLISGLKLEEFNLRAPREQGGQAADEMGVVATRGPCNRAGEDRQPTWGWKEDVLGIQRNLVACEPRWNKSAWVHKDISSDCQYSTQWRPSGRSTGLWKPAEMKRLFCKTALWLI